MHRSNKLISKYIISLSLLLMPVITFAQGANPPQFKNPLGSNNLSELLANVTLWLLGISAMFAVLGIIVGGVKIIFHSMQGDDKDLENSKKIVFWAIAGLVLIAMAYAIVRIVPCALGVPGAC